MDKDEMRALRAQYAYPPGCLKPTTRQDVNSLAVGTLCLAVVSPTTAEWARADVRAGYSSVALDRFHTGLLMSDDAQDRQHGLLSCVTWGFISGTDLLIKPRRALGRAGSLLNGAGDRKPPQQPEQVTALLDTARQAARDGDLATALRACLRIKFIGPAFATKLVMMMRPDIAAVLDSVINERLLGHGDRELSVIHGRMTPPSSEPALECFVARYLQWCGWCTRQAQALNAQGGRWTDWDGEEHPWRAVDVERAFFAMGRERAAH
ncbi:8-oxoguanine DNA glycosylase OGG fold protein [Massilia timonae]|uniref:8-oxoguanine DNA glycosylase OGG fold protein n=1 Tax=Massilia timonae TaxID=47229 RepID=UPI002897D10F|nr:hypothetical protein [Massilia timonae]